MFKLPPYRSWPAPWRKWGWRLAVAFVLYSVIGFFVLPPIIRSQLQKRLALSTHRAAAVRQVRVNPWALSLTVRGLALTETNGSPFASFEEFYGNFQLSSLFHWAWTFRDLSLKEPRAEIVLDGQGRFNFANLFETTNAPAPPPTAAAKAGIPRLLVFHLVVTNGHVGFTDLTHKSSFRTAYAPIDFDLKNFSTKPDRRSPYAFEASSDTGRSVAWSGTVTAQPPGSSGALRITGIQLPKHGPYLEDYTRAQLVEGTADFGGDYFAELGTNGLDLIVSNFVAKVSGLKMKDPDTGETVLGLASYEQRDCSLDFRARRARIGSLVVSDPAALARRSADGTINLLSLLTSRPTKTEPATNAPASAPPWELTLDDCRLERGSVQLEDAAVPGPFRALLQPVSLHLEHFTTRTNSDAALSFGFTTDAAESVDLQGTCSINPQRGAGALKVEAVELKRYQSYLTPFFRGRIASGKTGLSLNFSAQVHGGPDAVVSNLVLRVADLEIKPTEGEETILSVSRLLIDNASASLAERSARVNLIEVEKASVLGRREKDGTINLLGLLAARTNVATAVAPGGPSVSARELPDVAPAAGWRLSSGKVVLRDCAARVEDKQTARLGVLALDQLSVSLEGLQFPSNAPVQASFSARVNAAGTVSARGTIQPYTPAAEMEVDAAGLELQGFQPWIETKVKLGIVSGAARARGRVNYGSADAAGPMLHFAGELGVTNLLTQDQVLLKEFVRWTDLSVKGIDLDLQPNRATVEQVRFDGLKTSVIIGPDQRPNLLSVLPAAAAQTNVAAVANPAPGSSPGTVQTDTNRAGQSFPLQLGELAFENGSFHFADESIQPACSFDIKQFGGTLKGLSSQPDTTSTVALTGSVDEASPFGLHGKMNPLARDLTLNLEFTNRSLQLTPFTPYMEKFAGHSLNKGRLTLALAYAIEQGHLQASHNVRIDQLMLGPRNESPAATKLPVKLAVALLKDRNGQIGLDVPVEGRLGDPKFSVGPIILKVILNMITKAATSPFKLLGALVGGGEELAFVDFSPGESSIPATETNKIEKLGKALADRPALNLEIEASADPTLDRDALARAAVRDQIRTERLQELAAAGRQPAETQGFEVEPDHSERLLRKALVKQYGTNLTVALREFAASASSTNEPTARTTTNRTAKITLLGRVAGLNPFQRKNSPAVVARQQVKADVTLLKQNPEVATLTAETMEAMLAAKTEVPADAFQQLMQARAAVVQAALLQQREVTAERLFIIAPKPPDPSRPSQSRVNFSLN